MSPVAAADVGRRPEARPLADAVIKQRLAAILAADAAGYSRLMSADERATLAALDSARAIFPQHVEAHQGARPGSNKR
jgi:class 3 adenylate cyclase